MLKMKFALGLFLIEGIFFREACGQCNGEQELISPSRGYIITRQSLSIHRDAPTSCSWQLEKPLSKEYVVMLDKAMLRNVYVNDGKKCTADISLRINSEEVRCKDFIDPAKTNCKAYYSSPACKTLIPQNCVASEKSSFPLTINVEFQNIDSEMYFRMLYDYVECPSTDCPDDDADCGVAITGSGTAAKLPAILAIDTVTRTTTHLLAITSRDESRLNLNNQSTVTTPFSQPFMTVAYTCAQTNWPIFVFVLGSVVLILLVIVAVLLILLTKSRRQSKVATPTAFNQNCETPVVALENNVASEAPRPVEYVNLSSRNQQEIENPYEIPIRQNTQA